MENRDLKLRERLKVPLSEDLVQFLVGPRIRWEFQNVFEHQMQIHLAHTLMLVKQQIITQSEGKDILIGLQEIERLGPNALEIDYTLEDMYSHIERSLIRKIGAEHGGKLHTGRSRNDMGQTVWRMMLRKELLKLLSYFQELRGSILALAKKHCNTVMVGYTHGQHAQPITFGYYLAAFADLLERDTRRLQAAYTRINQCPLGAGALASTGFPIDRHFTSELLGFDGIIKNAYDAVSSRDYDAETVSCFAIMGNNLSRLSHDLHTWCGVEHSFVEIADQYAFVSSIMPQKKNPASLEYIRGAAGYVLGDFVALLSAMKTTYAYVWDVAFVPNASILNAVERSIIAITMMKGIVSSLIVKPETMLEKAQMGFATVTELADVITKEKALSFRIAHSIVAKTVAQALEKDKSSSSDITTDMLDISSQEIIGQPLGLAPEIIRKALDPIENVRVRKASGPAPEEVGRLINEAKQKLTEDEETTEVLRKALGSAKEKLRNHVDNSLSAI